ncbi:glycine cleavage system protein H [Streptomyces olivochromogenes]|uniref:hypothetical protein n=1 Tax=Streptomyces olivochromogenes TaxID=1963 RepID=UPI00368E2BEB
MEREPCLVSNDPYRDGWLALTTMSDTKEINDPLTARQYRRLVAAEDSSYSGCALRADRHCGWRSPAMRRPTSRRAS